MKIKISHRIISAILVLVMVFTILPLNVFAKTTEVEDDGFVSVQIPIENDNEESDNEPDSIINTDDQYNNSLSYVGWDNIEGYCKEIYDRDGDANVWVIETPEALKQFAENVNEHGMTYEGQTVVLAQNIDFSLNAPEDMTWTPIGVYSKHSFMGTFEGGNHEIINLNITCDSEKLADDEVAYIGFFGYVENATISDFGIYNYQLSQSYSQDTEIGALVAHAKNSTITNCYANGNIKDVVFENKNVLERAQTFDKIPTTSELNFNNSRGEGIIIDLSAHSAEINQILEVNKNISAVRIIGNPEINYTNFSIVVEDVSDFNFYLELVNFNFEGHKDHDAISISHRQSVYLNSTKSTDADSGNTISSAKGKSVITVSDGELYVLGDADLTLTAGNGTHGTKDNKDASAGGSGIIAKSVVLSTNAKVFITGGDGGSGYNGADGYESGAHGQSGGKGGHGGDAIAADFVKIYSPEVYLFSGNGGHGGNGGNGVSGHNGYDGGRVDDYTWHSGTHGQNGGNGGDGGNGGVGGVAYTSDTLVCYEGIILKTQNGITGNGGHGGNGANGGNGGNAGSWYDRRPFGGQQAAGNGGNAGSGGKGGNGGSGGVSGIGGTGGKKGTAGTKSYWTWWGKDYEAGSPGSSGSDGANGSNDQGAYTVVKTQAGTTNALYSYDNLNKGVTLTVESVTDDSINTPTVVKVHSVKGSAGDTHWGGYCHQVTSSNHKIYYYVIRAKIPVGYKIFTYSNSIGDGASNYALTDNSGTGEWEWYVFKTVCGSSGTFNTLGFVAVYPEENTAETTVDWYVADAKLIDGSVNIQYCEAYISQVVSQNSKYEVPADPINKENFEELYAQYGSSSSKYNAHISTWFNEDSTAGLSVYDNAQKGVSFSSVVASEDNPLGRNFEFKVTSKMDSDLRHWGGVYSSVKSAANKQYYYTILAKIPQGYSIGVYNNALGDGAYTCTLTDCKGTGDWQWYVLKTSCAASGTFSTLGFVAVYPNTEEPVSETSVEWYIAHLDVLDASIQTANVEFFIDSILNSDIAIQNQTRIDISKQIVNKKEEVSFVKLNKAELTVGGFVGYADATSSVRRCAAIVNNVYGGNGIDAGYDYNDVNAGNFICNFADGVTLEDVIAAYIDEDDRLVRYETVNNEGLSFDSWFGNSVTMNHAAMLTVSVLNDYTDDIGLVYDSDISYSNTVSTSRSVTGKIGEKSDVDIPDYVFGGRFITAVTRIAADAFAGNQSITTVNCGANIVSIGSRAFQRSSITKIVTGDAVVSIGQNAFAYCSELKSAVLGDSVSAIGSNIFLNSNKLETIEIGKSLVNIPEIGNKEEVFGIDKSQSHLKEYIVAEENTAYRSIDGILYELFELEGEDGGESRYITVSVIDAPARVDIKDYVPLDHIVKIYPNAFAHNKNIVTVNLDYIREIGEKAFFGATALKTVMFGTPEVLDSEFITILDEQIAAGKVQYSQVVGINAFQDCISLQSVNLESEFITKIGSGAFRNCATAEGTKPLDITLGKNISTINANYDELFNNLENGVSENAVNNFFDVFEGSKISSFNVVEGNEYYIAIDGVLYLKTGEMQDDKQIIWLIAYPRNKEAVIDSYGQYVPFEIPMAENMVVTRISKSAFSGVETLRHLVINNGVVTVDNNAFKNAKLYSITFGKNVRYIGTTPTGTEDIFNGCINLSAIYVDSDNEAYSDNNGILYNKEGTDLIKYPQAMSGYEFTAPDTVNRIFANAFGGNNMIRRITFVSEIERVGRRAFAECSNISIIYFKVGDAPFASKLEVYESGAFETDNARLIVCYSEENETWENISGPYCTNENYQIFSIERFAGYPIDNMSTGYYAVVVIDRSGAPINDIHVTLGETVKTQDGIAMFYNLDYNRSYALRLVDNRGEYFSFEDATFYADEFTRVTYITLNSVPTIAGNNATYDVYSEEFTHDLASITGEFQVKGEVEKKYVNINSETAKINKYLTSQVKLTVACGVEKDMTITKVVLLQNNVIVHEQQYNDNGDKSVRRVANISMTVDTEKFIDEQDVYVVAVVQDNDGTVYEVQTKLNLHVFTFAPIEIVLPTSNQELTLKIPERLQDLLGINDLSLLGKDQKLNYVAILSEDTYRVALEYNRDNLKEFGFDETKDKDIIDLYEEWVNNEKLFSATENKSKGSLGFSFGGFVEQKYRGLDENGEADILVSSGIKGTLEFKYGAGTTITIVVVPVRLDVEVTITGELELKLEFDNEGAKKLLPSAGELDLGLKGNITVYAGVGCKFLSIGTYGSIELYILLELLPDPGVEKFTITTDLGLYVKYDGLFITWKYTWSILDELNIPRVWVIIDNEDDASPSAVKRTRANLLKAENYIISKSTFNKEHMTFSLKGAKDIENTAYSGIDPKMIRVGDLVYIVYYNDLNGMSDKYDSYNYQKLVYQTYNINTGEFSEVYVLDDNGHADAGYEVYYDGTDAVILYSQLNKRLTSDDAEDMEGYVGALEVKTAILKDGKFVASDTPFTSDTYYDMSLSLGEVDGNITAVWVRNEENSLFGTTDNNNMSIWYSVYDGSQWSAPACLMSGINTITDIALGSLGVAYITDTNNDLATIGSDKLTEGYSDRIITYVDMSGNVVYRTLEEGAYHDVSCLDGEIAYYMDGNLYSINTGESYFDSAIVGFTDEYTVLTNPDGSIKALLFVMTVAYGEDNEFAGSNIFAIFRDGDKWGVPVQLTDFGKDMYVSAFDATDCGDKMLLSVLKSNVEYAVIDNNDAYSSVDYFETTYVEYPDDCVMKEVSFDYKTIIPENDTTLTVKVTNNSYKTLTDVPVNITRCGESIYSDNSSRFYNEDGTAIDGGLLPGATAYIKISFNVGSAKLEEKSDFEKYTVQIGDYSETVQLWYSDFEVYGKQVVIGDVYNAVILVSNLGYLSGSYNIAAIMDGEIIWDNGGKKVTLDGGESKYFTIPIDSDAVGDGTDVVTVCIYADDEYMLGNNETMLGLSVAEMIEISTDSLSVWLSDTSATIDRSNIQNVVTAYDDNYSFICATINEADITGICTVVDGVITIDAALLAAKYDNGNFTVRFQFADGTLDDGSDLVYKYATMALKITQRFAVNWVVDGLEIKSEAYESGSIPSCDAPKRAADAQYTYNFIGWDYTWDGIADEIVSITGPITYVAVFASTVNSYEVIWSIDGEDSTPELYEYGMIPVYGGEVTKTSDAQYHYVFKGWDKNVSAVTENVTYTAMFDAILRKYTVTTVIDGVYETIDVEYGTIPNLDLPTKASDAQYYYTFAGWSSALSPVYGNQTYTAEFERTLREYTVTWVINGEKFEEVYEYGTLPKYESIPVKEGNAQYTHTFIGWDRTIVSVNDDVTYTAQFESTLNCYTVYFVVGGETYSMEYAYGEIPVFDGKTEKESDGTYRYSFIGWNKEIVPVTGETVYTALYDATPIGSACLMCSPFTTAWGLEFTTELTMMDLQNLTETDITLYYNSSLVELKDYFCYEGVTVTDIGMGYIKLHLTGLYDIEKFGVIALTFKTSENAMIGSFEFLAVSAADKITANFEKLTIYQMGDVNMDGIVNIADAELVQQYSVKKKILSEEQLAYANVSGDKDTEGTDKVNTVDAAMILRYVTGNLDTLGQRIALYLIDGDIAYSFTMIKGTEFNYSVPDGYVWSLSDSTYVSVDFASLVEDTYVYLIQQD